MGNPVWHEKVALGVFVDGRSHGADDRQLIGDLRDFWKHAADGNSALPRRREFKWASHDVAVYVEHSPLNLDRHRLAVVARQPWLGVERIDVRHTA